MFPWVALIELLLQALGGGKIAVPVHIQDTAGSVDVVVAYDPKNGHIDFVNQGAAK